jgi:hypothetical protein
MPYFHVTAVLEACGASQQEADHAAITLLKNIRHPRVLYYEHETSEAIAPSPSAKLRYFTVIADLDVEAPTEENGVDLVEEVLDMLSTDAVQYLAHGITSGERRVPLTQQAPHEVEDAAAHGAYATSEERGEREERGGRKRGSRGRGRKRGGSPEAERGREDVVAPVTVAESPEQPADITTRIEPPPSPAPPAGPAVAEMVASAPAPDAPAVTITKIEPPASPPRSSAAMHVTLAVTLHASELKLPTNGSMPADQQELLRAATTEARLRHPELPGEVMPDCEVATLPWGDTVLTLTWHYDVRVPSATDAE